jgi:hypothetical protein
LKKYNKNFFYLNTIIKITYFFCFYFQAITFTPLKIFYYLVRNPKKLKQMKKVLFAAFLLVSSHSMFAQVNQGQWLVGGSAGFESGKFGDDETNKYTRINVSPNAGYFFIDKLAGGLRLGFESTKVKSADDANSTFSLAPFVRYYFLDAGEKVNIFLDGSYGFGSEGGDEKESFNEFAFMAGPAVFLSPNTALEFALYYKSAGGDLYGGDDRFNRFGLNIGFQVHLGNGGGSAKKK